MENGKFICKGEIISMLDKVNKKSCNKRVVVIVTRNGKYNDFYPIEFTNDRIKLLEGVKEGVFVEVEVKATGYPWNDRYYPSYIGLSLNKCAG